MKITSILSFFFLMVSYSCKKEDPAVARITAEQLEINTTVSSNDAIDFFISPFREHIKKDLDSVLTYNQRAMSDMDGELETALGNMIADMTLEMATPVFSKRTGKEIDFCLLNHGGIRDDIGVGQVTKRTAFKVLPFDNEIVVVELSVEKVNELIQYLVQAKRAHPIAGLQIELNTDYSLNEATISKKPIGTKSTYLVVTNDYLKNGGDGMDFLKEPVNLYPLDYKIRNALVDYMSKKDTLPYILDNRFSKLQ